MQFIGYLKDKHPSLVGYIKGRPLLYHAATRARSELRYGTARRLYHWMTGGHVVARLTVAHRLRDGSAALQVGGGRHCVAGWINGDIVAGDIYLDACRRLPFPNGSLKLIFTEHFFEHLSLADGLGFLREAHRVLQPGGVIRQSTPDLARIVEIYRDRCECVSQGVVLARHGAGHHRPHRYYLNNAAEFLNEFLGPDLWGHRFVYDRDSLAEVTRRAGFDHLSWCEFGSSSRPELRDLERHEGDVAWMRQLVMVLEATKV